MNIIVIFCNFFSTKSGIGLRRLTYPSSKPEAEMENAGVLLPLCESLV
jgi:hypothetical protein